MSQELETGVYVISSIAFPGGSVGVEKGPHAQGIEPRDVVSWPPSDDPEVVQVTNNGGGHYSLVSGGLGTSAIKEKLFVKVFPPGPGDDWVLEYNAEYDAYTITSQNGGWALADGDSYTQLDVVPNVEPGNTQFLFHFLRVYRPGH